MRIILSWLDHLRRTTVERLPAFCSALVSQFEELAAAVNTWGQADHNGDGTHYVVRIGQLPNDARPARAANADQILLRWDGVNLIYEKPDGTTGIVV